MSSHIALVYPSGLNRLTQQEKEARIAKLEKKGFKISDLASEFSSQDDITAGPVLDRAALFAHALTNRKFDILMSGRGGYGVTEMVPFLDYMLPPAISPKTFVGFSDNSYLGVYLSLKYDNIRYIHARHAFSSELFENENNETDILFDLLHNKDTRHKFTCKTVSNLQASLSGPCIPINLSLAESLAATPEVILPQNTILFLEDTNEYVYRMQRKLDSLLSSGFLNNVCAVVLGEFTKPLRNNNEEMGREELLGLISEKLQKPVIDFPLFGHGKPCFPLVAHSKTQIIPTDKNQVTLSLTSEIPIRQSCEMNSHQFREFKHLHLCGIGGTGMASVAGILKQAGYTVTGSDRQKVYPPMDKVLEDLRITPDFGYQAKNIQTRPIDAIVMGNVMSRKTAALEKNEELECILQKRIPVMSFPSALRKLFLNKSFNVVISGTHGKTTTTSLCTFLLDEIGENPSFLIGGMPGNFPAGFRLGSEKLFVLEADEYDSALFDKGPKFLHYEPSVTLINNIEFDHADIYDNVEQIEEEFYRLADLTSKRNGLNVVNWNDARVRDIANRIEKNCIAFESQLSQHNSTKISPNCNSQCPFPKWILNSFDTATKGITVHFTAPDNSNHSIFVQHMFGAHNALNVVGIIAILHAKSILNGKSWTEFLEQLQLVIKSAQNFKGIKRRFEFLSDKQNMAVFEDFAHHPTAIQTTLDAFREYMRLTNKTGRLIVCFDPHNATLRRNVFQAALAKSFSAADLLLLGKVPKDLRTDQKLILDENKVIEGCGIRAQYFSENENLLNTLQQEVKPCDTIVFMSSGSFDGIVQKFVSALEGEN